MILTLLSIDNKEFYFMTGTQKPENIARYIRKGKIKPLNKEQKADYIKNMAIKNFKRNYRKYKGVKYPYTD